MVLKALEDCARSSLICPKGRFTGPEIEARRYQRPILLIRADDFRSQLLSCSRDIVSNVDIHRRCEDAPGLSISKRRLKPGRLARRGWASSEVAGVRLLIQQKVEMLLETAWSLLFFHRAKSSKVKSMITDCQRTKQPSHYITWIPKPSGSSNQIELQRLLNSIRISSYALLLSFFGFCCMSHLQPYLAGFGCLR